VSPPLTPDSWHSLESLLERALDCPPEERAAFLRVACADDPERLRLLEELLADGDKPAPLLETPAFEHFADLIEQGGALAAPPPLLALLNEQYRIEREIGRGGMSVVYLADDLRHDRKVAVKIMNSTVTAAVTQERFHSEIRIAAQLTHPHIVALYDSGDVNGLLYFVMPYITGESLRARLRRDKQLPIEEAVQIACVVADALTYAHSEHIVHRDIKPENILFKSGHAMVCDFGIAHALEESGVAQLSDTGVGIGTPPYMSPEQVLADPHIDHRSDIYSLGCVLYEMLAGRTPFIGALRERVVSQHISSEPQPLRLFRPEVPAPLEAAVMRAIAKLPSERFATAAAFAGALDEFRVDPRKTTLWALLRRKVRRREVLRGAMAAAIGVSLVAMSYGPAWNPSLRTPNDADVDSVRYLVLPQGAPAGPSLRVDPTEIVRGGLRRWLGINVVDAMQLLPVLSGRSAADLSDREALDVGRRLRAGRIVRLGVAASGDSVELSAAVVDARAGSVISSERIRIAPNDSRSTRLIASLADSVLFPEVPPPRAGPPSGTRSWAAREAYVNAHREVEEWDLAAADSQLNRAITYDPAYAQAFLWMAQVRSWMGEPRARWSFAAERAEAAADALTDREKIQAHALSALSQGDVARACPLWPQLLQFDRSDYVNWYSWATCLKSDNVVVRDAKSPSKWSFRTSYNDVLRAYDRAFSLHPEIHRSYRGSSFEQLRRLLMTTSNSIRSGRAHSDSTRFLAHPLWQGDSLAFIPWPASEFLAAKAATLSALSDAALMHQRDRFYTTATMWRARFRESADAAEAVALALDLLGNPSALDTLRLASQLAREPDDRLRILTLKVWMQLRYSIPGDHAGVSEARRLADSLLAHRQPTDLRQAKQLAGLAALLGHANLAASFSRMAEASSAPAAIAETMPALLAFAALGGPVDSLTALETRVVSAMNRSLEGVQRNEAMSQWLVRSAMLAVPQHHFKSIRERTAEGFYWDLLRAWDAGDVDRARRLLGERLDARKQAYVHAADVTVDALYTEAAILASLGDAKGAAEWLDPTLDSLSFVEPQVLNDMARAGPLVRAMALRADLAQRGGDSVTAKVWARAVTELWSNADGFLQPIVRRMTTLAR
jgi:serine/threonine protein kinase